MSNQDVGGLSLFESDSLSRDERSLSHWERQIDALCYVLLRKQLMNVHELRFGIESIPHHSFANISYYERWMYAILVTMLKHGTVTESEVSQKYSNHTGHRGLGATSSERLRPPKFQVGDSVTVRDVLDSRIASSWRLGLQMASSQHLRTPRYIQNKTGCIESFAGKHKNPELQSLRIPHDPVNLYRVRFLQLDLWPHGEAEHDTVDIELMEHWLQRADCKEHHDHSHDHGHDHGHDHRARSQRDRETVERKAIDREPTESPYQVLSQCVLELLVEKGVIAMEDIRAQIETIDARKTLYETLGAKIAVRAWRDPEWKRKLTDWRQFRAFQLIKEAFAVPDDYYETDLRVVENTESVHHVIVCTLCSCYPRQILGVPPSWYKSLKYRSEMVCKPRAVLRKQFGVDLPDDVTVRVHDSAADLRYMVLPHFPSQIGPDWSKLSDEELVRMVTRDMLIGVRR